MDFVEQQDFFNANGKGKTKTPNTKTPKAKTPKAPKSKTGKNIFTKEGGGLSTTSKVLIGGVATALTAAAASKSGKGKGQGEGEADVVGDGTGAPTNLPSGTKSGDGQQSNEQGGKKNKTMLYVGIGAGVLVILGLVLFLRKK